MSTLIVPFTNYTSTSTSTLYWMYMEQVDNTSDTSTIGEVAELIDSLYGLDPCNEYGGDDTINENLVTVSEGVSNTEDLSDKEAADLLEKETEIWLDKVKSYMDLNLCDGNINGDYTVQVKVAVSHSTEPYTLRLTNGEIVSTIITEEPIDKIITIDSASSVTLDFPVISDATFYWRGSVLGSTGYRTGNEITRDGNVLSWEGGDVSGTLVVKYNTRYDLVTILVPGNIDGTQGTCTAICFYHGLVDSLLLNAPSTDDVSEIDRQKYCPSITYTIGDEDVVTCYESVTTIYRCMCSYSIASSVTEDVEVSCPSNVTKCSKGGGTVDGADGKVHCSQYLGSRTVFGGYVSCPSTMYNNQTGEWQDNGENSILGDADFYELKCCHSPENSLPDCQVKWEVNSGGQSLDPDVEAEYRRRYGSNLQLIAVSPSDGDCGYIKTTVNVNQANCCDGVSALVWDSENSVKVIADNSQGSIFITGGKLPINVSVRGSGFYLSGGVRDATLYSRQVRIYTANSCGTCSIFVDDGCSEVTGSVRSTEGQWANTDITDWSPYKGIKATEYLHITGVAYAVAYAGDYRILQRISYTLGNQGSYLNAPCDPENTYWQDLPYAYVSCDGYYPRWDEGGCISWEIAEVDPTKAGATEDDCGFCLFTEQSGDTCWYETMEKRYGDVTIQEWVC